MNHTLSLFVRLVIGMALTVAMVRGDDVGKPRPAEPATEQTETAQQRAQLAESSLKVELLRSVLGETSPRPNGVRYLVNEFRCTNPSDGELTLAVADIHLHVDGQDLTPQFQPESVQGFAFELGQESRRFRDLELPQKLRIPPGESQTAWMIFTDLPGSGDVPQMTLEFTQEAARQRLSLNEAHQKKLKLGHQRIGPRGILGLLTISGELDTINVGSLVDELNRLSNQGVSRAVVTFADSATPLPDMLAQWIQQAAQQREQSRIEARFPAISPTIRELQIASLPGEDGPVVEAYNGRPYLHRTTAAAVEWALEPVFRELPANEIVAQIEQGHPFVRAAALATGGRQLAEEHLPLILRLAAKDDDPLLRRGALLALSEFGQPAAIDCLVTHARSKSSDVATLAVECLAASRFEPAHEALGQLIDAPSRVPLVEWGHILARYPRQRWIEPLRELAAGEWTDPQASFDEQTAVRRDALIALERIGHPDLVDLLGSALTAEPEPLRQTAFTLLMNRTDDASERMAVEYALELTQNAFPSQQILSLFQRVRDHQTVPLLVKHLDAVDSDRSLLIKTLAQIGPATIDRTLAGHYDTFHPREQATVISSLTDLDSPLAFDLAKQGIASDDNVVFHPSVRALQEQGTPEAVAVLSEVLLATSHSSKVNSVVRALEGIGTNDAINALRRARYAGDSRTEQLILRRLVDIQLRSPGAQHMSAANEFAQQEQWEEAVEAYSSALELDPELSEARSGRGHCRLHLEQLGPAGDDFRQALSSNPYDSLAVTGLGIVLVREGNAEQGLQLVEEASDRFPHDMLYAYNTACVYGRALEATLAESNPGENDSRVSELQDKAITQLRLAAERGFDEFDFMKRDPDLSPLRDLKEFQQLETPSPETQNP